MIIPAITVRPVNGTIGAVIGGIDLRESLSREAVTLVRQVLSTHGVVFFQDQDITVDQYWAFMANFGRPQIDENIGTDHDGPEDVQTGDFRYTRQITAIWHSDTTCLADPPIATALRAVEVPPFGGDTCWASMYAAWDALSEPMQRMLGELTAVHSVEPTIDRTRECGLPFEVNYNARSAREQVHPVALTHPESGRKALYVSELFTTRLVELDPRESTALLDMLFRHVGRPEFTMRWKWSPNDIALWDNRSVLHYAVPDYEVPRRMQRIVLAGY